ncbi:MAG: hypothetical protein Q8S75_13580, partial [Nitrospirota bacterium]|nr:hypothetical protein [Nitrospirota bacterium]
GHTDYLLRNSAANFGSHLVPFETGHFMMAEDPEGFRRALGGFFHDLKKYASCHQCSPER